MNLKRAIFAAAEAIAFLAAGTALAQTSEGRRSAYSYVRAVTGEVTVVSKWNGSVAARRNMPISVGDEISVADGARVEVGMADGNLLQIGGGTRVRFESLFDQQGEEGDSSAVNLLEGSAILTAVGDNEAQIPRVDTEDASIYVSRGARVRVNADSRRGTVVIGRAGSAEVRTRQGNYPLKAGQYLMIRGDEEPEIARGAFSRDRFDLWSADRIESYETRSASARYVDNQYASDVEELDGYGDWDYSATYSANVWVPRVATGWTPYSNGSWYYTPVGLTWGSYDPWGWYPFHYGNWFFDSAFSRWCWSPANVYSPAWVYWAYTPSYVGWCPIGFYSPWSDNYYRSIGWGHRNNLYLSLNGTFSTRRVDFRGWNFVGAGNFGAVAARMDVIPGSRIADRLGPEVAISSRPIVVNPREGGVREAIQAHVREAPRTIERAGSGDGSRFAPVLARERNLPPATLDALRDRAVVAERGRLSGRAASDLAPRGAIVERSGAFSARPPSASADQGRGDQWRGRGTPGTEGRPAVAAPARQESRSEGWRSRSEVPPARRVIDGALSGRRAPEPRPERAPAYAPPPSRGERTQSYSYAPPPARGDRGQSYSPPPPRAERAHVYSAPPPPAPRAEGRHEAPPPPAGHPERGRKN